MAQHVSTSPLHTFEGPWRKARLEKRYKRFIVEARALDGDTLLKAHLGDPGRMPELMRPGRILWLSGPYPPPRKLAWSVRFAELEDGRLVSLDASLSNRLVPEMVRRGLLPELPGPEGMKREYTRGGSRFDLAWPLPGERLHLAEIKTVNLHHGGGLGGWPDAPSTRAHKHVQHLITHLKRGQPASLIFVTGRDDIERIRPEADIDPEFASLFAKATHAGLQVLGARVRITPSGAFYAGRAAIIE